MKDALLLVDVLNDFEHEDGDRLLESFRERHEGMVRALGRARAEDVPVVSRIERSWVAGTMLRSRHNFVRVTDTVHGCY